MKNKRSRLTVLVFIGIFIVVWGAAAGLTTSIFSPISSLCSENPQVSILTGACTDIQLSIAFGWLVWVLRTSYSPYLDRIARTQPHSHLRAHFLTVLAYFVVLLTFAIMSSRNGQSAWKSSIREASAGSGRNTMAPSMVYKDPTMMASNEQFLMKSPMPQGYGGGAVAPTMPYQPNAPYDPHVAQGALGYPGPPRYNPTIAQV
jgi:uncharacterized membrane protein YhaH (DUF805 family)